MRNASRHSIAENSSVVAHFAACTEFIHNAALTSEHWIQQIHILHTFNSFHFHCVFAECIHFSFLYAYEFRSFVRSFVLFEGSLFRQAFISSYSTYSQFTRADTDICHAISLEEKNALVCVIYMKMAWQNWIIILHGVRVCVCEQWWHIRRAVMPLV